jgi:Uma2 family endonuclease
MNAGIARKQMRIDVNRYEKMIAAGVLTKDDRVELIDGEMLEIAPIGTKHVAFTTRLLRTLIRVLGEEAIVCAGGPVRLGDFSLPEPDMTILRPRFDDYAGKRAEPTDVLLVIEVSDSSLSYDREIKRLLYARYGIVEYWIIDVQDQCVHVYRQPRNGDYAEVECLRAGDVLRAKSLPRAEVNLQSLFA